MTAEEIIKKLNLIPHPKEGGYFSETYRSKENILQSDLPSRYSGSRSFGTCIYYLLTPQTISALHRLKSDEIFHFYLGDPVEMIQLFPDGSSKKIVIGNDLEKGELPQVLAPRNVWQGSRLKDGGKFALLGCTVAPGFDYTDYDHGSRTELIRQFPDCKEEIIGLTFE